MPGTAIGGRILHSIYAISAFLAAASLFAIFVLMLAQIVARQLDLSVPSADDIAGYGCVAVTFLALAETFRRGELIRVGLLLEALSPGPRRACEIASLSLALVLALIMTWWSAVFALDSYEIGEVSQGSMAIPLWLPQIPMALGAACFALAIAEQLAKVLGGQTPDYVLAEEDRRARGDFSAEA